MTGAPHAPPEVDVRLAEDRFRTRTSWLDSRHSFSFGAHYDPANTHHGRLLVSNDDVVRPGTGFETHPHRDMEIVTWVLEGSLVHQDSAGHRGVIHPGLAQRMSAGTGVLHSVRNDAWRADGRGPGGQVPEEPVRFLQMWVLPDESGQVPGYEQSEVGDALSGGDLVTVASGMPRHRDLAAVRIGTAHAALHVARPGPPGAGIDLPEAPWLHVYVARGGVEVEGVGPLGSGDALRLTASGGRRITASEPAEVLVWEMHAGPTG